MADVATNEDDETNAMFVCFLYGDGEKHSYSSAVIANFAEIDLSRVDTKGDCAVCMR